MSITTHLVPRAAPRHLVVLPPVARRSDDPPPRVSPVMPPPATPEAGWYGHPTHSGCEQWWDGHRWTAHLQLRRG